MRWVIYLLLGVTPLPACKIFHFDRNAPGIIDVARPPAPKGGSDPTSTPRREAPRDPGEHRVLLRPGILGGGGVRFDGHSATGVGALGIELTALYGQARSSHQLDTAFIPFLLPAARHAFGINLGAMLLERQDGPSVGPLYVEAQYAFASLTGAAAGYAWDAVDGGHGPQVTLFFGPLYTRTTVLIGRGTELHFGLTFKLPTLLVWSR